MDILDIKNILEHQFGDRFSFHPDFFPEFVELIKESGAEKEILVQFLRKLSAIVELGDCDSGLRWLEKLKKYDNMYSLHLQTKTKNYRLLFSKIGNGKLFLHIFFERAGKGNSSYAKHVPIAIQRREDFLKENENVHIQ